MTNKAQAQAAARHRVDVAVRECWAALYHLSDFGEEALRDDDFLLWRTVTVHPAVQKKLKNGSGWSGK